MSGWFSISTIAKRVCTAGLLMLPLVAMSVGDASAKVYEMVSPVDKNGVDAQNGLKVAADGSAVAWLSIGSYAGGVGFNAFDAYVGRHQPDGSWHTTPLYPKATDSIRPGIPYRLGGMAFDADLTQAAVVSYTPFDPADLDEGPEPASVQDVYQLSPGKTPVWVSKAVDGPTPNEAVNARLVGVSADGSSIFFKTTETLSIDASGGEDLYRWRDDGPTELVGRGTDGAVLPGGSYLGRNASDVNPGNNNAGDLPDSAAVSTDGKVFVYGGGSPTQLYLHNQDGSVTLLSASQATATRGAPAAPGPTGQNVKFLAALPDFSVVYFSSYDQLTDDAPVGGGDYAYDVRSGRLWFSNIDDSLTSSVGPVGFIRTSDDGRYVYFGSTRGLAPGGTVGGFNLYVKGPEGTRFVAPLSLDDQFLTLEYYGKSPLLTPTGLSADGTKFVFLTYARATAYDNAGTAQIYAYDAVADELRCVSCNRFTARSTGSAALTNSGDLTVATPRPVSADGRQIVFAASEGLVPEDTNGVQDVYQDVDGVLSLLSTGTSSRESKFLGMSEDGSVKFISTRSSLVAQDIDNGVADVYAVREGDPVAPAAAEPACAGDDCQGPAAGRVSSGGAAGSVGLNTTRGNAQQVKRTAAKVKKKAVRCKKGYVKKFVRGGSRCVKKRKAVSRSQKSGKVVNRSKGSK